MGSNPARVACEVFFRRHSESTEYTLLYPRWCKAKLYQMKPACGRLLRINEKKNNVIRLMWKMAVIHSKIVIHFSCFFFTNCVFLSLRVLLILKLQIESFFPCSAYLWNSLPGACFPPSYDISCLNSHIQLL